MNTDAGYKQAIENVAYAIDQISVEVINQGHHPIEAVLSIMSKGDMFDLIKERAQKVDNIIAVISQTYHRSYDEIDRDITKIITEMVEMHHT